MEGPRIVSPETQAKLDKSKHVVRYRGISLVWLLKFWQRILDEEIVSDVELVVAKEMLAEDVWEGRTMEIKSRESKHGEETLHLRIPYRKSGELQQCFHDKVKPKPRKEWTIADICDFVIIPMVMERKCFFSELDIIDPEIDVGLPFEGAFVSQARTCPFADLLMALESYYNTKSGGQGIPERTFVWLDLFCANQPLLTANGSEEVIKERCALLTEGFHIAIENFDERLFFFNAWVNPPPLSRAWCIWEIYGAIQSKKTLQLIFVPGETDRFLEALVEDPDQITMAISEMRPQDAKCFDAEDRRMIAEHVMQTVGWVEVKRVVVEQVMQWLKQTTHDAVLNRTVELSEEYALFLNQAGSMMRNAVSFEQALDYHERAYEIRKIVHGTEEHASIGITLMNMASVYFEQGVQAKALDWYQRASDIFMVYYGTDEHPNMGTPLVGTANVFQAQGDYDQALEYYQRALDILLAADGAKELRNVKNTLNNMAAVYLLQGHYTKSLSYYQRALHVKKTAIGIEEHLSIAQTLDGIASVFQAQCQYARSLEYYQHALDIYIASHGTEVHPATASTLSNMAVVFKLQHEYAKALEYLQRALEIDKAIYGSNNHPRVGNTLFNMATVYEAESDYAQAINLYQDALDVYKAAYGTEEHSRVGDTLHNMAEVYHMQGDYAKSLESSEGG